MSLKQPIATNGVRLNIRIIMYTATSVGITQLHLKIYVCVREIGGVA
jgi:hypothetical protein